MINLNFSYKTACVEINGKLEILIQDSHLSRVALNPEKAIPFSGKANKYSNEIISVKE
jgi:hypothetical protein